MGQAIRKSCKCFDSKDTIQQKIQFSSQKKKAAEKNANAYQSNYYSAVEEIEDFKIKQKLNFDDSNSNSNQQWDNDNANKSPEQVKQIVESSKYIVKPPKLTPIKRGQYPPENGHDSLLDNNKDENGDTEKKIIITDINKSLKESPILQAINVCKTQSREVSLSDFLEIRLLGKGAFGYVKLVSDARDPSQLYAMKEILKAEMVRNNLVENVILEKRILLQNDSPFLVQLKYYFQTKNKIFLVMEYIDGGDLYSLMKKHRQFSIKDARFYFIEVLLGIQYLHEKLNIMYRDLKPENIMLCKNGHIKLIDFGLSKQLSRESNTFAGTPEYFAPEMLRGQNYNKAIDFWALGIFLYEMINARPPFFDNSQNLDKISNLILQNQPVFSHYFSEDAKQLILGLLQSDPNKRLGANGIQEIKNHPFFANIQWQLYEQQKVDPPILNNSKRHSTNNNGMATFVNESSTSNQALPHTKESSHAQMNMINLECHQ